MSLLKFTNQKKALDILQNSRFPISNPKYFNDPFDSRVAIDDNDLEAKRLYNSWPRCPISVGARGCYKNPYEDDLNRYSQLIEDAVSGVDTQEIEKWRIACFSRQTDWIKYIQMWSLYADSHKGVMFEFNSDFENYIRNTYEVSDVQYSNERVIITFQDSLNDKTIFEKRKKALTVKSKAWEYEKETRLIIPSDLFSKDEDSNLHCKWIEDSYRDFMRIDCKWISKIVCGAMMPQKEYDDIKAEAQKKSITCTRLRLCAVNFKLHEFAPIGCKY